jgi:hypothetical protein
MRTVTHGRNKIEIYDSVETMPIDRFQAFNLAVLIDAGVGADFEAFDKHIITILRYIEKGDRNNATQALLNWRQNVAMIMAEVSPETEAFATLVKSIGGKDVSGKRPEEIQGMLDKGGLTVGLVRKVNGEVKKKSIQS